MADTKVTTIRQPVDQAEAVDLAARVDGVPTSEFIREAITAHLAARRADPDFQARLRERLEADRRLLERLAE